MTAQAIENLEAFEERHREQDIDGVLYAIEQVMEELEGRVGLGFADDKDGEASRVCTQQEGEELLKQGRVHMEALRTLIGVKA